MTSPSRDAQRKPFTVLALESSADDTCAAVVTSDRQILSNVIMPQHSAHEPWGGIHPAVAILHHQDNMPLAVKKALEEANITMGSIDGVAFTRGPGMSGCLSVGMNAAKTLASSLNKPLVGVHHMQAHALTVMLTSTKPPDFPFLTLLISGGHTMILLASSTTSFSILATTADVSIGNAFDKVSRSLGLPWGDPAYPTVVGAGPILEKFAEEHSPGAENEMFEFPVPMRGQLAFSYGGLISSVQRYIAMAKAGAPLTRKMQSFIASTFQKAAVKQLEEKLCLAIESCHRHNLPIGTVIISGGVASNKYLRSRLESFLAQHQLSVQYPPPSLCTDNAAMIGWASMYRFLAGDPDPYTLRLKSTWLLTELGESNKFERTLSSDAKQ